MSRRSTRRLETRIDYTEDVDDGKTEASSSIVVKEITKTKKSPTNELIGVQSRTAKKEVVENIAESSTKPKKSPANSKTGPSDEGAKPLEPKKGGKGKRKAKLEEDVSEEEVKEKNPKKKRKTKEDKENEAVPLATRTDISTLKRALYIGAHVSAAGGVQNSINNSLHIGGNAFALFLKSQRKWVSPPLAPGASTQFKAFCEEHQYDAAKYCLPHGSYLVNLAQPDPEKAKQALDCFVDDLQRCESLGIRLYNFHPGSSGSHPRPEAISRIAKALNKAHAATSTVVTVLENMAGAGNIIGSTWEDLRDIIAEVHDKSRVGVCIDTCHTFARGFDLRSPDAFQKTMDDFSKIVGMKYLKALHLNDSKAPMSSNRDLHANIGTGCLGLRAFHNVVNFEAFQNLPMILETPIDKKGADGKTIEDKSVWATEIKLLEGLIGADVDSEEFKAMEKRLQDQGAEERKRVQEQVDKKGGMKGQRNITSMFKAKGRKETEAAEDDGGSDEEEGCNH